MPVKSITLSRSGGEPQISVFIGQAQYGKYEIELKRPGGEPEVQRTGDNADDVSDTFGLKTPLASLDGWVLSWWIIIAAPATGQGQLYFARVVIEQGGKAVPGGAFEYKGPFDNTKNIIDVVRLSLA